MKKLFLGLFVAAFTLSTYSCRETTEENVENDMEEVGNDLDNAGEEVEADLEETGDELEQAGENVGDEMEEEVNEDEVEVEE